MADLPAGWALHEEGQPIPEGSVLYQGITMPLGQFNALSAANLIGARGTAAAPQPDPNIMPGHVAQRLRVAEIGSFSGLREESGLRWIRSAQTKLEQVGCDRRFWIPEIVIRLKFDAAAWAEAWHQDHPEPRNYEQFKADFLTRFEKPVHEITIAQDLKKLRQTGTLEEYTRAYEELRLRAPPTMVFDSPTTCVNYLDGLKPYITRQVDFSRCTSLQATYEEAENARGKADSLFRSQRDTKEKPLGSRPPRGQGGNRNGGNKPYERPATSHAAGSSSQSNRPPQHGRSQFRTAETEEEEEQGKASGSQ